MNNAPPIPNADAKTSPQALWSLILGILSITCLWIFGSIPAIILGILGLKKVDQSQGALKGRGLAIAGIITGGVGVIAGITPIAIVASLTVPVFTKVQDSAQTAKQVSTVKSLIVACHLSASEHGGNFPKDLNQLLKEGYIDSEEILLWKGNSSNAEGKPYLYRTGLTDSTTSIEPVIASPEPVHRKRIVGFSDGHVEELTEDEFQANHADKF